MKKIAEERRSTEVSGATVELDEHRRLRPTNPSEGNSVDQWIAWFDVGPNSSDAALAGVPFPAPESYANIILRQREAVCALR